MLSAAISLVPIKPLVIGGGVLSLNKRVVFPVAKKIASGTTKALGILTPEEAKKQEELFDNMMFPIDNFITNVENEIYNILIGGEEGSMLSHLGNFLLS